MRDKYDEIKSLNPNRAASVKSANISHTPSREQREAVLTAAVPKKNGIVLAEKKSNAATKLVCSPCYNKRLLAQKQIRKTQEDALEKVPVYFSDSNYCASK